MMLEDKHRGVGWMQDDVYGFPNDFHISWKFNEKLLDRFTYVPEEKEKMYELLKRGEGFLNSTVSEMARIVNDSYYGENNARFYAIRMDGGIWSTNQAQFFLDNAAKEKRKPTAIKNGSCCESGLEFRTLFFHLNVEPAIRTLRVLSPYDLPPEYQTEQETQYKHVQTGLYFEQKHWALVNAYTPQNDLTLIGREDLPPVSAVQGIDQVAAANHDDFTFSKEGF